MEPSSCQIIQSRSALCLQSPFGWAGCSLRGAGAGWGLPCLTGRCKPGLHVWLTSISGIEFPFSKGSSQSNSSKHREAKRLLLNDQSIPMLLLTKQWGGTCSGRCSPSRRTGKEKQSFHSSDEHKTRGVKDSSPDLPPVWAKALPGQDTGPPKDPSWGSIISSGQALLQVWHHCRRQKPSVSV